MRAVLKAGKSSVDMQETAALIHRRGDSTPSLTTESYVFTRFEGISALLEGEGEHREGEHGLGGEQ